MPAPQAQGNLGGVTVVISTRMEPTALISSVRDVIRSMAPTQPLSQVEPMDDVISDSLRGRKLTLTLLGVFAGLALLLCTAGGRRVWILSARCAGSSDTPPGIGRATMRSNAPGSAEMMKQVMRSPRIVRHVLLRHVLRRAYRCSRFELRRGPPWPSLRTVTVS